MTANRVKTTTTTTGTGNITVSATPAARCQPLSAIGVGKVQTFVIEDEAGTDWEMSVCTVLSATTISRNTVLIGSNGTSKVNFAAGTKAVRAVLSDDEVLELKASVVAAQSAIAMLQSGGAGAGGGVRTIPFSTSLSLDYPGITFMADQPVTGQLALTVASGAVAGSQIWFVLTPTANGTPEPTIAGAKKFSTSGDWDGRAGIQNGVNVFRDLSRTWWSIGQELGAVAEPTPATAVTMTGPTGGVVNIASTAFTVNTNGTRSAAVVVTPTPVTGVTFTPTSVTLPIGAAAATFTATSTTTGAKTIAVTNGSSLTNPTAITYTATASATAPATMAAPTATAGDGMVSVAYVLPSDGGSAITSVTVTLSNGQTSTSSANPRVFTVANGAAVTATAFATNNVNNGTASPASNSVTPAAAVVVVYPRMTAGYTNLTEGPTAPYTYTGLNNPDYSGAKGGIVDKALQAGVDGSMAYTRDQAGTMLNDAPIMGTTAGSALVNFAALGVAIHHASSAGGNYLVYELGTPKTATNAVPSAAGDVVRQRRINSGGAANTATIISEVSKDGGQTWQTIYTSINQPTGVLRFLITVRGIGRISNLTAEGLA